MRVQHVPLASLENGVAEIRRSPKATGKVVLIARRQVVEEREVVGEAELDPVEGLVGDCWRERGSRATEDGAAHPDMQLTLMNARAASLVAGPVERWPLAGDQLVGSAVVEVTAIPHTGCGKFARRFGVDALKFVNSPVGRELNLRGINTRIVSGGTVRQGDAIRKAA